MTAGARVILGGLAISAWLAGHAFEPEEAAANVIPRPESVTRAEGSFVIAKGGEISFPKDPAAAQIARYLAELLGTNQSVTLRPVEVSAKRVPRHAIELHLVRTGTNGAPEGYTLEINAERAAVTASDPRGLFNGAVTLWQLCPAGAAPGGRITLPAVRIVDAPRFRWRGLMLDSVRHFQSPEFVLNYIDWMALHKLNVLAWHLTDDQGWRLAIRKYPRLTSVGAWRVPAGAAAQRDIDPATGRPRLYGGFYSQDDVRRIVAHAAERYVTLVPEIDMPGHATAAIVAYPQLGVTDHPPAAVPEEWGVFPNLYNVEESTFAFLEDVLAEVIGLFPSEFIHVGGDEAVKDQWKASPRVQARMHEFGVANEEALQGYFTQRMGKYLETHGRRLIGWTRFSRAEYRRVLRSCPGAESMGLSPRPRAATMPCYPRLPRCTSTTARARGPVSRPGGGKWSRSRACTASIRSLVRSPARRPACSACRPLSGPSMCAPRSGLPT